MNQVTKKAIQIFVRNVLSMITGAVIGILIGAILAAIFYMFYGFWGAVILLTLSAAVFMLGYDAYLYAREEAEKELENEKVN